MGVITFNSVSSSSFGLEVETFPTYDIPEKEYDVVHVPGRNGDLLIDNNTFSNVSRKYKVSVATQTMPFYQKLNGISEWLHSASGYSRLEDTYEPDFYRMACYREGINIENLLNEAGRATITFDCKPQKFLKSGEAAVEFTQSGVITNPTAFASSPIIKVYSNNGQFGTVYVGGYSFILLASNSTCIEVNSEIQDVYDGYQNRNSSIVLNGGDFPKLLPGDNNISFTANITKVEVIPKWWTI